MYEIMEAIKFNKLGVNGILVFAFWQCCIIVSSCGRTSSVATEAVSAEDIRRVTEQDSIFRKLQDLTDDAIPRNILSDSLAFLILPVQASCPSCRGKTIDSIVKYKDRLANRHYIVISASGGRKTIRSFFSDRGKELPVLSGRIILDSTNFAYKAGLYKNKPTIYYTYNEKAYKKVAAIPTTVEEDLREFFSGDRK